MRIVQEIQTLLHEVEALGRLHADPLLLGKDKAYIMIEISSGTPEIRLFASDKNWIEGEALKQLGKTAELDGIELAAGMPDLHPGRGNPVGAAFISKGVFYPYLVGNDVGCGMGVYKTTLKARKAKRDKWARKLSGLEEPWEGDAAGWLEDNGLDPSLADSPLGSIGGGNHFAELQVVEKIFNTEDFQALELDKSRLVLLVHSGSRGIGEALLRRHTERYGSGELKEDSEDALAYLEEHDYAVRWAEVNRAVIAHRFASRLGARCETVLDCCHNSLSRVNVDGGERWLHRKGAAPADAGPIVAAGTRGTLSHVVAPAAPGRENGWSAAHGAGRKWNRKSCKGRLKSKYNAKSLLRTDLGGVVICEDKELLFEEAPPAYKNIDVVVQDMVDDELVRLIAAFRPLITYKCRESKRRKTTWLNGCR